MNKIQIKIARYTNKGNDITQNATRVLFPAKVVKSSGWDTDTIISTRIADDKFYFKIEPDIKRIPKKASGLVKYRVKGRAILVTVPRLPELLPYNIPNKATAIEAEIVGDELVIDLLPYKPEPVKQEPEKQPEIKKLYFKSFKNFLVGAL